MSPIKRNASQDLAAEMTRAASRQTYYTMRFLVDPERRDDAYRAYAYFRWVDDVLDARTGAKSARMAFLGRQQALLEACYRRELPGDLSPEETMLADLTRGDQEADSGLRSYLRHMMAVMAFDVERRGRLISQAELTRYTDQLATAVTDALFYFIGHDCPPPCAEARYQAVQGAHIIHMLRDFVEDADTGYYNIPKEAIFAGGIAFQEVDQPAHRAWVKQRVALAAACFKAGRAYIRRVGNLRCRLAGFCYLARFEWMARRIEQDGYILRAEYPERKSLVAGLLMAGKALNALFGF